MCMGQIVWEQERVQRDHCQGQYSDPGDDCWACMRVTGVTQDISEVVYTGVMMMRVKHREVKLIWVTFVI